jgi:predicted O-methyltransferase YrrM
MTLAHNLRRTSAYRVLALPFRAAIASRYPKVRKRDLARWLLTSREDTNFTYDLRPWNMVELAAKVADVTGAGFAAAMGYIDELESDAELRDHLAASVAHSRYRSCSDAPRYARRAGWYAIARIMKPSVIVETGVDKGLGSAVLCAALRRNVMEGAPGRYYGLDINPDAGWLLRAPYSDFGEMNYGDAIGSLKAFNRSIDLFINDSDHRSAYEAGEYAAIAPLLTERAIVLSDNSHETDVLARFSERHGRKFTFFGEQPKDHWYPGAGIGFSYHDGTSVCM